MVSETTKRIFAPIRRMKIIYSTAAISALVFIIIALFKDEFSKGMSVASFLTWHNFLEIVSILISLSIFLITYYTYEQTWNFRMMLLGITFLITGFIDIFHTLSYKGMPDFFISNVTANRATTFWVIARLTGAVGILAASFIPENKIIKIKKAALIIPSLIFIMAAFIIPTYLPDLIPAMYIEGEGLTNIKVVLEYVVIALLLCAAVQYIRDYYNDRLKQTLYFVSALTVCIFSGIAFVSYASVYSVYNHLGHIYKVVAYYMFFSAIYTYNIRKPYNRLLVAEKRLKENAENLDELVRQRTSELENLNKKLVNDIESARTMQLSLLPAKLPEDLAVSFSAKYFPAERLSGDFYNIVKIDDENIAFYIGDVSGHGVSAAILTVFANQNIKPVQDREGKLEVVRPSTVLKSLYNSFNETNFCDEMYIVLFYAIYNKRTRKLIYSSGGLNTAPILIKKNGELTELDNIGFAIYKLSDEFLPEFVNRECNLESGDKILFYTDGLTEAKNLQGDFYSQEALMKLISCNRSKAADQLSSKITESIFAFTETNKLEDDITYVLMEIM